MLADGADEDAAAAAFFQIVMCWQSIIFGFNVIWYLFLLLRLLTLIHLTPCIVFLLTLFKRCMVRMMFCCCSAFRFLYLIIFHSLTSIPDFYFNLKKCNAYSFFCVPIMCAEAATTAIAVAPILVEESCYRCCRCCCCWPVGQSIFFFLRFSLMRLFLFFT